jgi:hypothetical protein
MSANKKSNIIANNKSANQQQKGSFPKIKPPNHPWWHDFLHNYLL